MNGYTLLNLDKPRGFKWGKYASELYVRTLNKKDKEQVGLAMEAESTASIVYAGLMGNCFVKQVDPDFTFEDVVDMCDVIHADELKKLHEAIHSSQYFRKVTEVSKKNEELLSKDGGKQGKKKGSSHSVN